MKKKKKPREHNLPLRMSLKLLLTVGGKPLMQRKHVEPRRQGKRMLRGKPRDSESCKLHEDSPKGWLNRTESYDSGDGNRLGGESLTDGED